MTVLDLTALRLQQQNARQYVHNAIKKGSWSGWTLAWWEKGAVAGHHGDYVNH